ncbi:hypothetical protein EAS56_17715 [Bradyrhizobium guangzhouense]|uniref:Apea-like HEPN domain-containing protein n=1 Tax=Bradyrhizobium guangzhouense TaxID=1325095 RepID=A0ABY0E7V9_9BRAD|nr:HEPN domain-containing protein [Bradyrhizobium guangzhouense]RXH12346.1 hypothetical protein EAS56_17715 [Bradyrhizobium guangzhouense]
MSDRETLVAALEQAVAEFEVKHGHHTLLARPQPDPQILGPVEAAIDQCAAYQEVAGHLLYTANGGRVISSGGLRLPVFQRAQYKVAEAADWLLRLLSLRSANGSFRSAIWGISVTEEIRLSDSARLVPFATLTESFMKKHVTNRARRLYEDTAWISTSLFGMPVAAFVMDAPNFPYIRTDNASFLEFDRLQHEAMAYWIVLEAASVGSPLAFGYWFEYEDEEIDIAVWENWLTWTFPEVSPRIGAPVAVDAQTILDDTRGFLALPERFQSDLRRSMNRFMLSKCRTQLIDRVLDLALAFEIAVSGESESWTAISWKVAVRSAQAIGGPLDWRRTVRRKVGQLYDLRSKATHGGNLGSDEYVNNLQLIEECSAIYRQLLRSFFDVGVKPDWRVLELEPRHREP